MLMKDKKTNMTSEDVRRAKRIRDLAKKIRKTWKFDNYFDDQK